MAPILVKIVVTTVLVVLISEVARRSTLVGGLIASLPVVSVLALIWLYVDEHDPAKVARLSTSICWLVLPSLALFIALPLLLRRQVNFYVSLGTACVITIACYGAMLYVLGKAGVKL